MGEKPIGTANRRTLLADEIVRFKKPRDEAYRHFEITSDQRLAAGGEIELNCRRNSAAVSIAMQSD